jgi:hypothetical protein
MTRHIYGLWDYAQLRKTVDKVLKTVDNFNCLWITPLFSSKIANFELPATPHIWGVVF